jgi:hypothetical protein
LSIIWDIQLTPLALEEFGSTSVSEPVLDHGWIIDLEGGPSVASAVSNPVAPDLNNTLKLRAMMRSFSFSPSAGSIISRTRDLFLVSPE